MNRQKIAIDCDDVMAALNEPIRLYVNVVNGTSFTTEDFITTGEYKRYWERIVGIPDEEPANIYYDFLQTGRARHLQPLQNMVETITELKKGYDLAVVTARSKEEVDITHEWLNEHLPGMFKDIHFMHLWESSELLTKAAICREIGAGYLIDDNFDHCRLMGELGMKALLFGTYGWNRDRELPKGVVRVNDWQAVGEYFAHERQLQK